MVQIRAPWDDRLWSVVSSECKEVTHNDLPSDQYTNNRIKDMDQFTQIVNDNLVHRRRQRQTPSARSGVDENPQMLIPAHDTWSGCYVDIPMSNASLEYKVQYTVVFKADGIVEGSGSSAEGNFAINGVYNLQTGDVAWRQASASCPVWFNPCSKYGARTEAEFFGKVVNFAGPGPFQIAGTFLTDFGRYCALNLTCARGSEAETRTSVERAGSTLAREEALPTLLTARLTRKWTTIKNAGDETVRKRKQLQKQCTNSSDTYHCGLYDDSDDDDEEEPQKGLTVTSL